MDTKEVRLLRFRQIWKEMFGGNIAALARRLGKSSNQIRFYLNPEKPGGRGMGEDFAREIEEKLGKDKGWLDRERDEDGTSRIETVTTASATIQKQEQNHDLVKLRSALEAVCEAYGVTLDEVYLARSVEAGKPKTSVKITSGDGARAFAATILGQKKPAKAGNQAGS